MTELSTQAQQKIQELTQTYINSFPEKVKQLEDSWRAIEEQGFASNSIAELNKICHKIAGSAGSYQLQEISTAAKAVEQLSTESQWQQEDVGKREHALKECFGNLILLLQKQA